MDLRDDDTHLMAGREFIDHHGLLRRSSVHDVNVFTTARDAATSARYTLNGGAPYRVWQMSDGLFDWTAVPDPEAPWLRDGTLVESQRAPR